MCDRVAVMYLGKIVELAAADELYAHPRHPYTGALLQRRAGARPAAGGAQAAPGPRRATCRRRPTRRSACRFHTRCPKAPGACCDVDEPLLEPKDGGNVAACHFPLTDEEVATRVPTAGCIGLRLHAARRSLRPPLRRRAATGAPALRALGRAPG